MTRFCLRHCAPSQVTVVELADAVIETAHQWFALPRKHPRLVLLPGDAMDYLQANVEQGGFGILQVDLYDMHARGPVLDTAGFYRACAAVLADPGIAVFNLFGAHASTDRNLARIARAFGGRVLTLPINAAGNLVVLAFKGPPIAIEWARLEERAEVLRRALKLPAHEWVRAMKSASGEARLTL